MYDTSRIYIFYPHLQWKGVYHHILVTLGAEEIESEKSSLEIWV